MKNKKKLLVSSAMTSFLVLAPIAISCKQNEQTKTQNQDSKTQNQVGETFDNKVVFQAAQGAGWPLMIGLREVIKIYNEDHKNDPDFLPVELQDQTITKTFGEDALVRNILEKFYHKKNSEIPNILLNSPGGAFLVNQYERLLNLENSKINGDLFGKALRKTHSKIPGSDIEKLYAIPFDISTIEGLVFNIDIMAHIFEQIRAGGGKINLSETNALKTKIDQANQKGNTSIPEGKMWKYLVVKSNESFKGYEVNDDSFDTYEGLQEFASKVYDGLKLKDDLSDEIKEKILQGQDAKVFRMDYQNAAFGKFLYDRLDAYDGKNPYLWNFEKDQATGKEGKHLDYNFKKDERIKNILLEAYQDFTKDNKVTNVLGEGLKAKKFRSIYYSTKGNTDWSTGDILRYNTAFAYVPHLGYNGSYATYTIRKDHLRNVQGSQKELEDKWQEIQKDYTKEDDVYYTRQTTRMKKGSQKAIFNYGGSSLVTIKTSEKRDKATIKFLEWIFTGDLSTKHGGGKVKDLLRNRSRYIVPTVDRVTEEERDKIVKVIEEKTKIFKDLEAKENKTEQEIQTMEKAQEERNYLMAVRLTLDDILESIKRNEYNRANHTDGYTTKVWGTISRSLLDSTRNGGRKTSSSDLWEEIKKIQE
ncbi:LIPOPROTEIN [Mycoplasmopsis pulmonis]|uniref:LIPOPROTEIN n=1 Tax=Mycoplasmopsis pulmonis (strain UAB CTIP) TaxID=272635 RepID=Q98QP2_MYCPU|nr:hypothetical protein [Mycoplasmopsis pulmonis]MDZ7293278.1 hypothetical protein [Mycoplasmopsis pulmonis]CAC13492.1 LIPOPROTEIN [Mycoplasmopsis pulmonis]VEU68083.1 Uncharacterised protein [Mycoplasmopsis pulmonis]